MIKIKNEEEKNQFFDENIKEDGSYFNVKYPSGENEFIWVKRFEKWNDDGSDWFLEYPNEMHKYDVSNENLKSYYDEELEETITPYGDCYIENNEAYEITSWQVEPFLPEEFEIEFVTDNHVEAAKYLLKIKQK